MFNTTNSRFSSRFSGLAVGLTAGVMLSLSLAAWANHNPIDPMTQTTFADGELITAMPFNLMFDELYGWATGTDAHILAQDDQIAALQAQIAALQPASPCGQTAAVTGSFGGYAGGKALSARGAMRGNHGNASTSRSTTRARSSRLAES